MKEKLIIYVTLIGLLFFTKELVEHNKTQYNDKVKTVNKIQTYDIRSALDKLDKDYQAYLKRQEKWNEIVEYNRKIEEQKQEEQRKQQEELERQQRTKEVLLEVSFYHDGLRTASGVYPTIEHTIACPKEIPFGSIVKFEGKEYVCEDRGGYIKKVWSDKHNDYLYRVDVYVSSETEAYKLGRYVVKGIIEFKR